MGIIEKIKSFFFKPKVPTTITIQFPNISAPEIQEMERSDVSDIEIDETGLMLEALASEYELNVKLLKAVAQIEGRKDPFVEYPKLGHYPKLRFEPHWFNKYEKKNWNNRNR